VPDASKVASGGVVADRPRSRNGLFDDVPSRRAVPSFSPLFGVADEDRVGGVPSLVEEVPVGLLPDAPAFDEAVADSPVRPPERADVDGETASSVRPRLDDGTGVEEPLSAGRPFVPGRSESGVGVVDEVPDRPLPSVVDRLGVTGGEDVEDVEPLPRDTVVEADVLSFGGVGVVSDPRCAEEDPLRAESAEDDAPREDGFMAAESERADGEMRGAVSDSSSPKDVRLPVSPTSEEEPAAFTAGDPVLPPSPSPSPSRV
jgi:hypothetical protein